jgi:hypothetical protein
VTPDLDFSISLSSRLFLPPNLLSPPGAMSRTARDATRFTPNVAQSYARASQSGARTGNTRSPSFQSAAPSGVFGSNSGRSGTFNSNVGNARGGVTGTSSDSYLGETPQQKVARLRAEHMRQKAAQLTAWDRIILRSRSMADAAHRWTMFGILTFSGKYYTNIGGLS